MCIVNAMMQKDENYVRGWIKLHPDDAQVALLAQYAIDLQKLRHKHEETCPECK